MPNSYAEKAQRWTTLCANAEPLLGSVPAAAQALHSAMKADTAELGGLADRIQELEGQAHALAKRRQELVRKVSEDAHRLKIHLQALLGPKNPDLLKLGIRPQDLRKKAPSAKARAKAEASAKGSEGLSVSAEV